MSSRLLRMSTKTRQEDTSVRFTYRGVWLKRGNPPV
uniref:Uncharacterized protein n=1 Tax=Anguilla anguilla TaxID=7936 RepID=A0A0E9WS72_ANGAN